jgi:hypothetical protein
MRPQAVTKTPLIRRPGMSYRENSKGEQVSSSLAIPPAMKMSRGSLIREAIFADYGQIANLQIRNGHCPRSYEHWRAIWTGNPVYKQGDGKWPIGWVLETEDGRIVGSIGNIPLAYQFRNRRLYAATPCSWIVDAAYRTYAMALMSCLMRQTNVNLFICTSVNSASEPTYRSGFRFSAAPVGTWDKSEFWITNYRGFSESALTWKSFPLLKGISYPVSAALFCWDKVRGSELPIDNMKSDIELCQRFDGRFDEFWDELKRQKQQHLLAERTRETLEWHFQYSLMRRNIWILTTSKGSRLVAYGIFDRLDSPSLGLKRIRFVDFQTLDGYEKELGSILCWVMRKCREEGIHVVENAGCCLNLERFRQIPTPYQRNLGCWMYYYKAADKNLSEALQDPAVWAPSSFDGDASL